MHAPFRQFFAASAGAVALLAAASLAQAGLIGSFDGANVDYNNVTEVTTQLPGPNPPTLFGTPTVSGDSLVFANTSFVVAVTAGSFELQDGRLSMEIDAANQGGSITTLALSEGGAFAVDGSGSNTFASASLLINGLTITGIDGNSVNPVPVPYTESFTASVSGQATYSASSTGITFRPEDGFGNGVWNGMANFDIASALADLGLAGHRVTAMSLVLDNQLVGSTIADDNPASAAFIDKKFFDVIPGSPPVPEPTTAGAALLGALALLARRRTV